jgi:rhodanese-related sulfurtransferase
MNKRTRNGILTVLLLTLAGVTFVGTKTNSASAQTPPAPANVQFVSVAELKSKIAKSEPITIIDVRGSSDLLANDNKIKGAIYVKLRKLKSRLAMPPLKDVPKNREVVTYCACPNDEASIRAAEMLSESGFTRVRVLKGGWLGWKRANGIVEPLSKVL